MVAVVDQGRVVVERGYGVKKLGSPEPPGQDTVFYIGSVSKAVTAVGAMLLVEQGKLDLDQPIERYLKGLPPGVTGFHSMWQIVPSRGVSIVMLWNLADQGNDFWGETAQILAEGFGIPALGGGTSVSQGSGEGEID